MVLMKRWWDMPDYLTPKIALIDGDVLRYRCGFAAQNNYYDVYDESILDLGPIRTFTHKRAANAWINKEEGYLIEHRIEAEPIDFALHSVKVQIHKILSATEAEEAQVFLTGEGNFRDTIATILPYKGNRDPEHKPIHYDNITTYLLDQWDATIVNDMEADDALGIIQYETFLDCMRGIQDNLNTIICTIDKDLDMIPGWHYNFVTQDKYLVSEQEAIKSFYTQLLTGDRTDNIQGIPGIGPKKAAHILEDCETEDEMYRAVRRAYEKAFPQEDIDPIILENGQLLWILRRPGELWQLPVIE